MDPMAFAALAAGLLYASPLVLAVASAAASWLHAWDEVFGEGRPLWEWAGVPLPYAVGVAAVGIGLPLSLTALAWFGYAAGVPWCLGVLCGARLGDAAFSHVLPALRRAGNPGLMTAPLLAIEGVGLAVSGVPVLPAVVAAAGFGALAAGAWVANVARDEG